MGKKTGEKEELPFRKVLPVVSVPSGQLGKEMEKKQVRFGDEGQKKEEPNFRRRSQVEEQTSVLDRST